MKDYLESDNICLETLAKEAKGMNDGISISLLKLFVLLYADDTVIFSETVEVLQRSLSKVKIYCNSWNLKLNTTKC